MSNYRVKYPILEWNVQLYSEMSNYRVKYPVIEWYVQF